MVDEAAGKQGIAAHDGRQRHCPMLGQGVGVSYCRTPGDPCPCRKIFDCWFETFDIEGFITTHYSESEIGQITHPTASRLATVLEAVARAKGDLK
ncbi:MAG: hypothetical protein DRI90_01300 [Deltaproteobacteria bacterium]|nr:MAG: hypothetical protein DRI90_01300 [Deltaproteobacteria bacterium]